MQNAKAANMPKDTVERAIKKATEKDASDYKEIVYEGYGPFGIAIVVEAATDNNTRTVANVRSYFNKHGGNLGTQGSLSFLFDHKSIFKIKPKEGVDHDELELEAIDYGVEEIVPETVTINEDGDEMNVWAIYGPFEEFANIQKFVEEAGLESSYRPSLPASPTTSRKSPPSSAQALRSSLRNLRRTRMCRMSTTT